MDTLRISLFGQFRVQYNGYTLTEHYPRKQQELLCYLLLHRDRAHPRETLSSLFWDANSTAKSKKYLRQALWQLQNIADPQGALPNRELLLIDADWVRLNPAADLWLDVEVFERAFVRAQDVPGHRLDNLQAEALREAADLYTGDLLEGWFQDWCLYERERLQNTLFAILEKLVDFCEAHGTYEEGLAYGARILRFDQARERTHRRVMRLYSLAGHRTAALRQYDRCVQALRRELSVKPAARTIALYQEIRKEELAPRGQERPPGAAAYVKSPSRWGDVLADLKQLQVTLSEVQGLVQHAIRTAEANTRDRR
jgi:DNA-binding SARP family transcriptional activator